METGIKFEKKKSGPISIKQESPFSWDLEQSGDESQSIQKSTSFKKGVSYKNKKKATNSIKQEVENSKPSCRQRANEAKPFNYANKREVKAEARLVKQEPQTLPEKSFNDGQSIIDMSADKVQEEENESESDSEDLEEEHRRNPLYHKNKALNSFMKSASSNKVVTITKAKEPYTVEKDVLWGIGSKISNHECSAFIRQSFQETPWLTPSVLGIECPRLQLHNELVEFYKVFGPNPKEMNQRLKCFKTLRKTILRYVKSQPSIREDDCKVSIFGSCCTNLYVNSNVKPYYGLSPSDIDVVVNGRVQLMDIHTALEHESDRYDNLHVQKAKVSLVRGEDMKFKVEFDISLNEVDGIKGSKIVNDFKKEFPELKYLVTFLKIFLSVHDLNKTYEGGISSFGLIMLVVSYLQQHKNRANQQAGEEAKKTLLSDHLINILKLYGSDFNYRDVGISVRKGGFYYKRDDKGFDNSMTTRAALSLESPIDPDINLGKAAHKFHRIQDLFSKCHEILTSTKSQTDLSLINMVLPTQKALQRSSYC